MAEEVITLSSDDEIYVEKKPQKRKNFASKSVQLIKVRKLDPKPKNDKQNDEIKIIEEIPKPSTSNHKKPEPLNHKKPELSNQKLPEPSNVKKPELSNHEKPGPSKISPKPHPKVTSISLIKSTSLTSEVVITPIEKKRVQLTSLPSTSMQIENPYISDKSTAFTKFLNTCRLKDEDEQMEMVLSKLNKKYNKLDRAERQEMANLLLFTITEMNKRDAKVYVHIQNVNEALKSYLKKPSKKTNEESQNSERDILSREDKERLKTARNIERAMRRVKKKIKQLAETEVDFDEDKNSSYIKYEAYKKRWVDLHNLFCKYTQDKSEVERQFLKLRDLSVTNIPQVNKAIVSFINANIARKNELTRKGRLADVVIFPDFEDILRCIKACNKEERLGYNANKEKKLAESAFKKVGIYLQNRRKKDFWETYRHDLETSTEDPAKTDTELLKKLQQNKVKGDKKLNNIFEKFVKKQEGLTQEELEQQQNDVESDASEDPSREKLDESLEGLEEKTDELETTEKFLEELEKNSEIIDEASKEKDGPDKGETIAAGAEVEEKTNLEEKENTKPEEKGKNKSEEKGNNKPEEKENNKPEEKEKTKPEAKEKTKPEEKELVPEILIEEPTPEVLPEKPVSVISDKEPTKKIRAEEATKIAESGLPSKVVEKDSTKQTPETKPSSNISAEGLAPKEPIPEILLKDIPEILLEDSEDPLVVKECEENLEKMRPISKESGDSERTKKTEEVRFEIIKIKLDNDVVAKEKENSKNVNELRVQHSVSNDETARPKVLRIKSFARYTSPSKNDIISNTISTSVDSTSVSVNTDSSVSNQGKSTNLLFKETNNDEVELIAVKQDKKQSRVTVSSVTRVNYLRPPMVRINDTSLNLETNDKRPVLVLRNKNKALIISNDTEPLGNITVCENFSAGTSKNGQEAEKVPFIKLREFAKPPSEWLENENVKKPAGEVSQHNASAIISHRNLLERNRLQKKIQNGSQTFKVIKIDGSRLVRHRFLPNKSIPQKSTRSMQNLRESNFLVRTSDK